MIQLNVLSGKKAGNQTIARRFPFRIGRGAESDLQLDDAGVWDQHLALELQHDSKRFTLTVATNALAAVNSESVQTAPLRNGDVISFGSVKIQFCLAATEQRGLWQREIFVWALVAAVIIAQFGLLYWLLR